MEIRFSSISTDKGNQSRVVALHVLGGAGALPWNGCFPGRQLCLLLESIEMMLEGVGVPVRLLLDRCPFG